MATTEKDRYNLSYPTNISNKVRQIVSRKGDRFIDDQGVIHEVKQVLQPPIGNLPELLLTSQSETSDEI